MLVLPVRAVSVNKVIWYTFFAIKKSGDGCTVIFRKILLRHKADSKSYIAYLRKRGVQIGRDVRFYSPSNTLIDLQAPWLLSIGDNVKITHGVIILTHDYSWSILKRHPYSKGEILGAQSPVTIGNNVFIGMNAVITRGVSIGDNVIIGAGSVVTKDCDSDSIYAGNPARKIMTLEEYCDKRRDSQFEEAKKMALVYRERFGTTPPKEIFSEYFMLFCNCDEAVENSSFDSQLRKGCNYDESLAHMCANSPMFSSYEAFLAECYRVE